MVVFLVGLLLQVLDSIVASFTVALVRKRGASFLVDLAVGKGRRGIHGYRGGKKVVLSLSCSDGAGSAMLRSGNLGLSVSMPTGNALESVGWDRDFVDLVYCSDVGNDIVEEGLYPTFAGLG